MKFTHINKEPKLFFKLLRFFFKEATWDKGVIFFIGDNLYSKYYPSDSILAHELVHREQQKKYFHPYIWWFLYMVSSKFRFNQELPAHRAEYRSIPGYDGNKRGYLDAIADRLSSKLYNNLVSKEEARRLILRTI